MFLVKQVSAEEWKRGLGEYAHAICFEKKLTPEMERLDYALLCIASETNSPVGYVTVRELSHDSVYWRFGGAFPLIRNKIYVGPAFMALVNWQRAQGTKYITFVVKNDNKPMLKLALATGFKIIGVRAFGDEILVEHIKEL